MFLLAQFLPRAVVVEAYDSHTGKRCKLIFYAQRKRQRGTERDIKTNIHDAQFMSQTHTLTLSPFGQLSGKQNISQLALCVGPDWVVVFFTAQVIKLNLAHRVSYR